MKKLKRYYKRVTIESDLWKQSN